MSKVTKFFIGLPISYAIMFLISGILGGLEIWVNISLAYILTFLVYKVIFKDENTNKVLGYSALSLTTQIAIAFTIVLTTRLLFS